MQCPVCKTKRCEAVELEGGLKAARCVGCAGHWIAQQNYAAWLKRQGDQPTGKPGAAPDLVVHDVRDAKLCPECGLILLKYKVGHGLDFFVDHCPACGGIWLDTNEWNALQGRELHDELHKVFSANWQSEVRSDQTAAKLDQVYAGRLGKESYEKAKDIRNWLKDHPQRRAILAFLSDEDPYRL